MIGLYLFETLVIAASVHASVGDFTNRIVKGEMFSLENPTKLIYTFDRVPVTEGPFLKAIRSFKDPAGGIVALEELFYEGGKVKKMTVDMRQVSETGSFELKDGRIFFSYTKDGKTKTDDEKIEEPMLVADNMAPFIKDHWDKLGKGETIKFRLPVPSRLETVGFKFQKDGESTFDGKPVDLVKMSPSSAIIAMLVKPIYFSVERAESRHVVKVVGRTVPKIQKDGKWTDFDAISIFSHPETTAATGTEIAAGSAAAPSSVKSGTPAKSMAPAKSKKH
jgi:hypothetical protein